MSLINHIVYFICSSVASLIYKILFFFPGCSLRLLGRSPTLHLAHQRTPRWWLRVVLCPSLSSSSTPTVRMSASRHEQNLQSYYLLSVRDLYGLMLMLPSFLFVCQAVWALGNVAGDSPKCRDLVLGHGGLFPLLQQLNEHAKLSMLRNATWTLSNFCRGKPQPNFEQVSIWDGSFCSVGQSIFE